MTRRQYAALKDLTDSGKADLAATFANLASMLEDAGFDVTIEYHIGDDEGYRTFSVLVASGQSRVTAEAAAGAHLRIFMSEQTWADIASGAISPADAFIGGRVRVQGDTSAGTRILKHLAGTPGRIGICES
jgi:putative sterol carrier protein